MICDSFQIVGYKVKEWDTVAMQLFQGRGGEVGRLWTLESVICSSAPVEFSKPWHGSILKIHNVLDNGVIM